MKAVMIPRPLSPFIGFVFSLCFANAADPIVATPVAPPINVAVIDMKRVFARHPATEAASAELTEAREAARKEFKEQSNLLKEILQRHQELIRAGNRDEAAEQLKKANEAERSIAALQTTDQRDLEEQFRKAKREIMTEITEAVAKFNEDGRFAMVFDSSSTSSNGLPQVVHAPGAMDITEDVIKFIEDKVEQ